MTNGAWLEPPDFIDQAAAAEAWDDQDWYQWGQLRERLEELGVTQLRLHGPEILSAENPGPFSSVRFDADAAKPTLEATRRLVEKLMPPEIPFVQNEPVIVGLRGMDDVPEGAEEEEPGIVTEFDIGTGEVTVQLTGLQPGQPNFVRVPNDRVRHAPE